MKKNSIALILVSLWILAQIWSFHVSAGIDGPRNIDTGFKRLDALFKWQLLALCLAIGAAIYAIFAKGAQKWARIMSALPAIFTIIAVAAIVLFANLQTSQTSSVTLPNQPTTKPVDQGQ